MTDLPYTDADLRAEAARQLAALAEDPDFMGVGEAMETNIVPSTEKPDVIGAGRSWDSVLRENADDYERFEAAQTKVHDLIDGAADLSEWAIDLGANGFAPAAEALNPAPGVRVHFAFTSDVPDDVRRNWVDGIHNAIREGI
jgi:hypothetical protein